LTPLRNRSMSDEQPLKKLIQVMMKNYQLDERMRQKQVEQKWPEIVGELIAKHTASVNISETTLFVRVNSAPLKAELSFHRTLIKDKVNAFLGADTIKEVRIS